MSNIETLKSEVSRLKRVYRSAVRFERYAEIEADCRFRCGKPEAECEAFLDKFTDEAAHARAQLVEAEIRLKCAVNGWNRSEIV
jgi:hypothetical protein